MHLNISHKKGNIKTYGVRFAFYKQLPREDYENNLSLSSKKGQNNVVTSPT